MRGLTRCLRPFISCAWRPGEQVLDHFLTRSTVYKNSIYKRGQIIMFALVDVNSFYTSCETVWRPDLSGKPVVVLSNNDGCIVSRSAEAKALGIGMAEPYFKQKDLLQRHGVAVFSSNYALYGDMSQRVMTTLEEICPRVDQYSIDEAFVDLSGIPHLKRFGKYIRDTVYQRTMLTVGVGIAPTKTLANWQITRPKGGSAERWRGGYLNPTRQHRLMAAIPVEEVWGIGRRLTKKLNTMNITTVLDLAKCDLWFIRKNFSVVLERTVRELRGEPCLGFQEFSPAKHEIISSRSFGQRISDYSSVREGISTWAARAAEKLRAQHQYCRYIGAFIKSSPHDPDEPYYSNSAGITLLTPTRTPEILLPQQRVAWILSGSKVRDIKKRVLY
jgi:DNA polymerase V